MPIHRSGRHQLRRPPDYPVARCVDCDCLVFDGAGQVYECPDCGEYFLLCGRCHTLRQVREAIELRGGSLDA